MRLLTFCTIVLLLFTLLSFEQKEVVYVYPASEEIARALLKQVLDAAKNEGVPYVTCVSELDTVGLEKLLHEGYVIIPSDCQKLENDIETIDAESLHRVFLTLK